MGLADRCGKGRVLLISLRGEEVDLIVGHFKTGTQNGIAVASGIIRYADVGRELPGRVLGELP